MRTKLAGRDVFVCIISAGRPSNVGPLQALLDLRPTWVVPPPEESAYAASGAIVAPIGSGSNVALARNAALAYAFNEGLPCCMIDDDLSRLRYLTRRGEKPNDIPAKSAIAHIAGYLDESPWRLGGANSTDNAYFVHKQFATDLFIPSAFMVVQPNELRFDARLPMRSDYDYCCQHVERYGGALRCNTILPTFAYKTNAGGMQGHRTETASEESIRILEEKWPGWIHRNPKRTGEVLMRVPKRRREVMS